MEKRAKYTSQVHIKNSFDGDGHEYPVFKTLTVQESNDGKEIEIEFGFGGSGFCQWMRLPKSAVSLLIHMLKTTSESCNSSR